MKDKDRAKERIIKDKKIKEASLNENERKYRESEERYRTLIENINVGIYRSVLQPRVVFANLAMARMFGYSSIEEFKNALITDLFQHPEDRDSLNKEIFNKGLVKDAELHLKKKDGTPIIVSCTARVKYDENGNFQWIDGIMNDITEHKRIDEELKKHRDHLEELVQEHTEELTATIEQLQKEIAERKKAEELAVYQQQQLIQADKMATLGILASGIAHEINNPNNFILLNAKIFSRIWKDAIPILKEYYENQGDFTLGGMPYTQTCDRISQLINGMSEGAQRIQRIVQGLKDFARQDTSNLDQSVEINPVVETAILIVNNLIKKSTNYFSREYGSKIPKIKGNAQQLKQVIINLLTNACHALRSRENKLFISTMYDSASKNVIVKVCDEGIGIAPEHLERILDPFFTTKRNSGGTGLGLSISYNIIKAHGGDMKFVSEPDKGTTVTVTLPCV